MIPAVQTTAAHVQDLKPAPELLDGEKTGLYADASDQGIAKGPEWYEKPFSDTGRQARPGGQRCPCVAGRKLGVA